jgi:hypothetical protein
MYVLGSREQDLASVSSPSRRAPPRPPQRLGASMRCSTHTLMRRRRLIVPRDDTVSASDATRARARITQYRAATFRSMGCSCGSVGCSCRMMLVRYLGEAGMQVVEPDVVDQQHARGRPKFADPEIGFQVRAGSRQHRGASVGRARQRAAQGRDGGVAIPRRKPPRSVSSTGASAGCRSRASRSARSASSRRSSMRYAATASCQAAARFRARPYLRASESISTAHHPPGADPRGTRPL